MYWRRIEDEGRDWREPGCVQSIGFGGRLERATRIGNTGPPLAPPLGGTRNLASGSIRWARTNTASVLALARGNAGEYLRPTGRRKWAYGGVGWA
jgi:hypothetical protein